MTNETEQTLEEAALSFLPHSEVEHDTDFIIGFEFGAKWQAERMYSKKEVFDIIDKVFHVYASSYRQDAKEWFEKFNETYGGNK